MGAPDWATDLTRAGAPHRSVVAASLQARFSARGLLEDAITSQETIVVEDLLEPSGARNDRENPFRQG
jgi:hypothetical protein